MHELVRKADRAGVIFLPEDLKDDLPAAVSVMIDCPDVDWVREHLPKLMDHGAVVLSEDGHRLILTRYCAAQYAGISTALSKKMSERKQREMAEALDRGDIEPLKAAK